MLPAPSLSRGCEENWQAMLLPNACERQCLRKLNSQRCDPQSRLLYNIVRAEQPMDNFRVHSDHHTLGSMAKHVGRQRQRRKNRLSRLQLRGLVWLYVEGSLVPLGGQPRHTTFSNVGLVPEPLSASILWDFSSSFSLKDQKPSPVSTSNEKLSTGVRTPAVTLGYQPPGSTSSGHMAATRLISGALFQG